MPVGVRRSPSRLAGEVPLPPSHAAQGPASRLQQPPRFVQSRSAPWVEARLRATTVTSCVAEPVSSRPAKVGAQAAARSPCAEADAATASATRVRASSLIDLQTTDDGRAAARRARAPGTALCALRDARGRGRPAALVASRLPGRALETSAPAALVLGLRRPPALRCADRQRASRRPADERLRTPLRRALSPAPPAAGPPLPPA